MPFRAGGGWEGGESGRAECRVGLGKREGAPSGLQISYIVIVHHAKSEVTHSPQRVNVVEEDTKKQKAPCTTTPDARPTTDRKKQVSKVGSLQGRWRSYVWRSSFMALSGNSGCQCVSPHPHSPLDTYPDSLTPRKKQRRIISSSAYQYQNSESQDVERTATAFRKQEARGRGPLRRSIQSQQRTFLYVEGSAVGGAVPLPRCSAALTLEASAAPVPVSGGPLPAGDWCGWQQQQQQQ